MNDTVRLVTEWHGCYDDGWQGEIVPEAWLPIAGFESAYDVSNYGRVRSHHRFGRPAKDGILVLQPNPKGYLRATLHHSDKRLSRVVHCLVAAAFVGPQPTPRHECNHKDGRKQHNYFKNLEWVTPIENNAHARATGLWVPAKGEDHGRAILNETDVRNIRSVAGSVTNRFLATLYGVNPVTIAGVINRRLWKHVD